MVTAGSRCLGAGRDGSVSAHAPLRGRGSGAVRLAGPGLPPQWHFWSLQSQQLSLSGVLSASMLMR